MLPEGGESPPEFFALRLPEAAAAWGIALAPETVGPLSGFLARVDLWRRRTNLTGPFPSEELVLHALEAALGAEFLPVGARVADIGAGAGFPGVPLAILRPDLNVLPVEPRRRRREFLDGCAAEIGITNLAPSVSSFDGLSPGSLQAATARAVGDLPQVLGSAKPLAPGSVLLVWTTEPEKLAGSLRDRFAFEGARAEPGALRRCIARFRRMGARADT
jgi:16S rRNA G527 N7-methylase RsmG